MSTIILLNGCGSAGKTSIARSIQSLSTEPWITFGIDTFIDMLPPDKQDRYFTFTPGQNHLGPTMRVDTGPLGFQYFGMMPKVADMIASQGNNLIIDEVLLDDGTLQAYKTALTAHKVYYIGVFCDLKVMQERERQRADRCIGLSNDQFDRVHQGVLNSYDFKVDTTAISPFEAARRILKFVDDTPAPEAFQTLIQG